MKVASFPPPHEGIANPYFRLLTPLLAEHGIEVVDSNLGYLEPGWLWRHRGRVRLLHLHFLRRHTTTARGRGSARHLLTFIAKLLLARLLGYRIVWTMHNRRAHESAPPLWVGRLARRAVAHLSHAVVTHCHRAAELLGEELGRRRGVHVLPHPGYVDLYPEGIGREEARRHLDLPVDALVYLSLGLVRPYKGHLELLSAFRRLPDARRALVVAGKCEDPDHARILREAAREDGRIRLHLGIVPDEELQVYFAASDLAVQPYRNVLTSGSVLLAMSFGCPVAVPRLGCLPEVVDDSCGLLYDPEEEGAVERVLREAPNHDLEGMGRRARERMRPLRWEDLARETARLYRALVSG